MEKIIERKTLNWISYLRMIAMIMVITPHMLIFTLENLPTRYLRYFVLNPLHIIAGCGALGVSIFFIVSGFLSAKKSGKWSYFL